MSNETTLFQNITKSPLAMAEALCVEEFDDYRNVKVYRVRIGNLYDGRFTDRDYAIQEAVSVLNEALR